MSAAAGSRRSGRPAVIDVQRIAAAARTLPPAELTMSGVAQRLGVDRKSVNYHVSDKDGLLVLVTADAVAAAFADLDLSSALTWQQACVRLARAIRSSAIEVGVVAHTFRLGRRADLRLLAPVEAVLERLVAAGATPALAGRVLTTLSTLALASAHDHLSTGAAAPSQQLAEVAEALGREPDGRFPVLRAMVEQRVSAADTEQFEVDLQVLLAGASALLEDHQTGAAPEDAAAPRGAEPVKSREA